MTDDQFLGEARRVFPDVEWWSMMGRLEDGLQAIDYKTRLVVQFYAWKTLPWGIGFMYRFDTVGRGNTLDEARTAFELRQVEAA